MFNFMPVFGTLTETEKLFVHEMADAARAILNQHYTPLNDDRIAIFDEACAVYYSESKKETLKWRETP